MAILTLSDSGNYPGQTLGFVNEKVGYVLSKNSDLTSYKTKH